MFKNKNSNLLLLIIIPTIMIGLSIYLTNYYGEKSAKHFEIFFKNEINSKLQSFTSSASGINLVLKDNIEYKCRMRTSINENAIFSFVAKPNDLIKKEAFSDTLWLTSNNKVYQFVCYHDGQD